MGIQQLDSLLVYLYNNRKYQTIEEVHYGMNPSLDIPIVNFLILLTKLSKDGYVTIEPQTYTITNAKEGIKDKFEKDAYFISFEGIIALEETPPLIWKNKPYKWKQSKAIASTIWVVLKIIMIALNAVAILYLMWRAIPNDSISP